MLQLYDPPPGAMVGASVILLNGPPYSGKDTAGKYLQTVIPNSTVAKFAGVLKRSVHVDYGLDMLPDDAFELCKDEPSEAFFGETPRRAYIDKSEKRTKPFLGKDHFGKVLLRSLWRQYQRGIHTFFVTDSGFADEATPVVESIGAENCLLARIHAESRGCSFKGDSRTYIALPGVTTIDICNNGSIEEFQSKVLRAVEFFITNIGWPEEERWADELV